MNIPERKPRKLLGIALLLLSASAIAAPAVAENVLVPIKLDYPSLRQLMLSQLFNTPNRSAEVLQDPGACTRILLSDPRLRERQKKLEITMHVKADMATVLFGACTKLFNWEGDAKFLTEPVILPGARSVRLNILNTRLYNLQGQLITSGRLWDLADGQLQPLLSRYEVDLSPSLDELTKLLPEVLHKRSGEQIKRIADSLRLTAITAATDGIDIDLSLQIDKLRPSARSEAALSAEEIQQLEANWQMMDAMITYAVKHYAKATHVQELRDVLVEVLLDARYRLIDALAMPVIQGDDPVRHWFIDSWQRLAPVLRQISLEDPGQEPMLLISLLTATDALAALNQIGPSIGLDISANGLRRMGRLLIDQSGIDPLRYEDAVDPELRRLFQLPASQEPIEPSGFMFDLWPIRSAWAGTPDDRLKLWAPSKSELPEYLPIIRDLLTETARSTAGGNRLSSSNMKLYQHLVLATAWQESCWRQYVTKKGKVVTLRSSTGDAGLMQMNERVWRGLYDTQKLRWDTRYNARAGAEVLLQYLVKYALKRGEQKHPGGQDNLARAAYSAYNGGPGQTSRYRNPRTPSAHREVDAAFWKKYQAVKQGRELQVAQCLGEDTASITAASTKKPAPGEVSRETTRQHTAASTENLGKAWVLAQNKQHYTLQLAVFSSSKAVQRFIADTPLQGKVAIAPLGNDRQGQFLVLSGSYKTRAEADRQKQRYQRLKPWIRQFKDIHPSIQR